jgi:hypothetical protein
MKQVANLFSRRRGPRCQEIARIPPGLNAGAPAGRGESEEHRSRLAALWDEPAKGQFLRSIIVCFILRSAALLSITRAMRASRLACSPARHDQFDIRCESAVVVTFSVSARRLTSLIA